MAALMTCLKPNGCGGWSLWVGRWGSTSQVSWFVPRVPWNIWNGNDGVGRRPTQFGYYTRDCCWISLFSILPTSLALTFNSTKNILYKSFCVKNKFHLLVARGKSFSKSPLVLLKESLKQEQIPVVRYGTVGIGASRGHCTSLLLKYTNTAFFCFR